MRGIVGKVASVLLVLTFAVGLGPATRAQQQAQSPSLAPQGTFLLTIFFKHDQSKPLEQINAQLKAQGF